MQRRFPADFHPVQLVILLTAAGMLLYGWAFNDTIRQFWDRLDQAVFFILNGSLADHPGWQVFWAIGNNIVTDILMGTYVVGLFYAFMAEDKSKARERASLFLFMGTLAVTAKLCMRYLSDNKRLSASLELSPVVRLSDNVTWLKVKDVSNDCFPSDHGTLLLLSLLLLWRFGGRRFGLPMLLGVVVFSLPRLVGGAHWFTDMAVGSLSVTLVIAALALCTPVHRIITGFYSELLNKPVFDKPFAWLRLAPRRDD